MCLEFGEGHFDRIEVGTVGRCEEEPRAARFQDRLGFLAFMAGEIVEDDHVAGLKRRGELRFDIGLESRAVHGAVDDPWRGQSIAAQGCDEGLGFPMAKGRTRFEALVTARSSP